MARGRDPGFAVIAKLTDQFTGPIKRVNSSIAESTAKLRGFAAIPGAIARSAGLDKIGGAFANIGTQVGRLRSSVVGLLRPFTQIGLLAGGFGIAKFSTDLVKAGSELVALNKTTGIAIETLQEFRYAAEQSGVPVESMDDALKKLNKSLAAARKDTKGTSDGFLALSKGVGLSRKEIMTLDSSEVFYRVATAISNIEDPVKRSEVAMKIFGKSGADLLPVLQEGAAGLRELGQEARDTGSIMSTDLAKSAKSFDDTMTRLGQHIKGVLLAAFGELLPSMQSGAQSMDEWVKANREWIRDEIVKVVRDLVDIARSFAKIVRDDIMPAIRAVQPIWEAFTNIVGSGNAKLIALTSVVAPGIIAALFGIAKAVAGLGLALVANPIGAIIVAVVAAIAAAGYLIWKHWDKIVAAFEWAWDEIKSAVQAGIDFVVGIWDALPKSIDELLDGVIGVIDSFAPGLLDAVITIFELPMQAVEALWNLLPDNIQGYLTAIWNAITGMQAQLRETIVRALTSPIEFVKEKWNELVSWLTGIWDKISGIFGAAGRLVGIGGGGEPAAVAPGTTPGAVARGRQRVAPPGTEDAMEYFQRMNAAAVGPAALGTAAQQASTSEVTIDFRNMPQGVEVSEGRSTGNTDVVLNRNYAGLALAGT